MDAPDDFYCTEIISGRLPVQTLYVSPRVIAFHHTQPYWEEHIVVIPRKHIESLTAAARSDEAILVELLGIVTRMAREVEDRWGGCRISTNVGSYQSAKHLHFYIHAGRRLRDEDGNPLPT